MKEPTMPTALLLLGLLAAGSLGVLALGAAMLSARISREEEEVLRRIRDSGL